MTEPDPRRWWTLAVLCLSLVMVILGNTVLNVALPTLVRELGATSTQLQWIVDAYALVFAGLLMTGGALGDRFGRKGALSIGLFVFGAASAVSALATSADQLVATRAVMGAAGALVMPATLSILTNVFPPHERARAIAVWAGLAGAGAAIGPIASGWLLEHFSWGSVFLVNVPIVVLALVGGHLLVPTSRDPNQSALDPIGAGLSIVGLTALLYGIIEAPNYGWSDPLTLGAFAVAVATLAGFAAWELHTDHPMLDLSYFRNPRFSAASGAITIVFFTMFGMFFVLTQYLQLVKGYTALEAGVRTLPMALTMMVGAPTSARLVERFGPKRVVATGLTLLGVGQLLMSRVDVGTGYPWILLSLVVLAVGMANTMAPSTASIMGALPLGRAGVGSAVNDTTRELGGALGVAVLGSLVASSYQSSLSAATRGLPADAAGAAASSLGGALAVASRLGGAAGGALADAAKAAFAHAMGTALLVGAVVAFLAAAAELRWLPGTVPEAERRRIPGVGAEPPATATAHVGAPPAAVVPATESR
jgi:EmrB/QacA subfamily drug resistance transporter